MKKKDRKRIQRYSAKKDNVEIDKPISFRQKVVNLLKKNLFWTIFGTIAGILGTGGIYLAIDHYRQEHADITFSIGEIVVKPGTEITVFYLFPIEKFRNHPHPFFGYLPLKFTNKNKYDIENCIIWLTTYPFTEDKTIYELSKGGKVTTTANKKIITNSRFFGNDDIGELEDSEAIQRSCILYTEIPQERIIYKIPRFMALTESKLFEKFKIDTTRFRIDGYTSQLKDFFPLELEYIRKNNNQTVSIKIPTRVIQYLDIDSLITEYERNGSIGGTVIRDKNVKQISCILIYPHYYIEDGIWNISLENPTVYYCEYDTPYRKNIFRQKRKIVIYDSDGKIVREDKIKDTEKRANAIMRFYTPGVREITTE